jgi:hypothetical protein
VPPAAYEPISEWLGEPHGAVPYCEELRAAAAWRLMTEGKNATGEGEAGKELAEDRTSVKEMGGG